MSDGELLVPIEPPTGSSAVPADAGAIVAAFGSSTGEGTDPAFGTGSVPLTKS